MDNRDIFSHIDHTILAPNAPWQEIKQLCEEAEQYGAASVCLPPTYIYQARNAYPHLNICTVIGFPLGYNTSKSKIFEAAQAIELGANEIDMVINNAQVQNQRFDLVMEEIADIKNAIGQHILKVIVETCYLDEGQKLAICKDFAKTKADFIKTSTGFGDGGAKLVDIALFRENLPETIRIKAAGGIRTKEDMEAFLSAGCTRLGCSVGVKVLFAK